MIMMMSHDSIGSDIWSRGFKRELKHNLIIDEDKILNLIKVLTAVNQCHPFWASWTPCYLVEYGTYLRLFNFQYLDKNPGWVTDDNGYKEFLRIFRLVVNQSTVPVMEFHERVIFLSSAVLCKSMWCYYSLCKVHRDDTFYNLSTYVCDWSLGTHEFSAFNFILKIGCDIMYIG